MAGWGYILLTVMTVNILATTFSGTDDEEVENFDSEKSVYVQYEPMIINKRWECRYGTATYKQSKEYDGWFYKDYGSRIEYVNCPESDVVYYTEEYYKDDYITKEELEELLKTSPESVHSFVTH